MAFLYIFGLALLAVGLGAAVLHFGLQGFMAQALGAGWDHALNAAAQARLWFVRILARPLQWILGLNVVHLLLAGGGGLGMSVAFVPKEHKLGTFAWFLGITVLFGLLHAWRLMRHHEAIPHVDDDGNIDEAAWFPGRFGFWLSSGIVVASQLALGAMLVRLGVFMDSSDVVLWGGLVLLVATAEVWTLAHFLDALLGLARPVLAVAAWLIGLPEGALARLRDRLRRLATMMAVTFVPVVTLFWVKPSSGLASVLVPALVVAVITAWAYVQHGGADEVATAKQRLYRRLWLIAPAATFLLGMFAATSPLWQSSVALVLDSNAARSWDIASGQETFVSRLGRWEALGLIALLIGAAFLSALIRKNTPPGGWAYRIFGFGYVLYAFVGVFVAVPALVDSFLHEGMKHSVTSPLAMPIQAVGVGGGAVEVSWKHRGDYTYRLLWRPAGASGHQILEVGGADTYAPSKEEALMGEARVTDHPGPLPAWYRVQVVNAAGETVRTSKEVRVNAQSVVPRVTLAADWATVKVVLPAQGPLEAHQLERQREDGKEHGWEPVAAEFTRAETGAIQAVDKPHAGGWEYRVVILNKDGGVRWETAGVRIHVGKFTADKPANKTAAAPKEDGTDEDARAGRPKQARSHTRSCGAAFAQLYRRLHGGQDPTCFQVASN